MNSEETEYSVFRTHYENIHSLGLLAKLRKATIGLVMSSCPSVRMEQLGPHWTDFYEILQFQYFFQKSVEKIQVH